MPAPTTPNRTSTESGTLRIGDEWNAIRIIAHSQTHPLKAVCELIENAIDAKAESIQIVRRRIQGETFLEILDDGQGVKRDKNGIPDFEHIATHICDSLKRHLQTKHRKGIHGEFGIGLFSFWNLGEQLRMTSPASDGAVHELLLRRGEPSYTVRTIRADMFDRGTRVVVGPLLDSTRHVVTGEKIDRYLASELRDRIRDRGVVIEITDRIARKQLLVKPQEFHGERLPLPKELPTDYGVIRVALYLQTRGEASAAASTVAVCKDGTRVLSDISDLMQFDRSPWKDGRLTGAIDFAGLNLAPGTRQGIVPDEYLQAFVQVVTQLEEDVQAAIRERDEAQSAKANRQVLRQVKRAFLTALQELEGQYLYFDVPSRAARRQVNGTQGKPQQQTFKFRAPTPEVVVQATKPGQLDTVVITPRNARRAPGDKCVLIAKAFDANDPIEERVKYSWKITSGKGRLSHVKGNHCQLTSGADGRVTVRVTATKGIRETTDEVAVRFLSDADGGFGSTRGLPSYRLQAAPTKPWRSRFDVRRNEIIINSAHRDFIASNSGATKHRRYIGKLYAKEVVLLNFPHESSSEAMERLIEVMVRTEDAL